MLLEALDQRLRRAFSGSAMNYEVLSGLQREIGRELVGRAAGSRPATTILDVGMGTGRMTARLSALFPEARVVGIDFAEGMLAVAREKYGQVNCVQANAAALPFQSEAFGLIISNLVYQWLTDLKTAFRGHARCLRPGGEFHFTMFGGRTMEELCAALANGRAAPGRPAGEAVLLRRLPSEHEVAAALDAAGFAVRELRTERITAHFDGMMDLLGWLKKIGAGGIPYNGFLGPKRLRAAEAYYRAHYSDRWGVRATFEVIWVNAVKD